MAEYIKREDAINLITNTNEDGNIFERQMKALADIPTINVVEREASVWIKTADTMACYKCGAIFKRWHEDDLTSLDGFAKFCPCCGLPMIGESI